MMARTESPPAQEAVGHRVGLEAVAGEPPLAQPLGHGDSLVAASPGAALDR